MSFSEPKLQNPAKKFIEFKGDTGIFQYYDKEKREIIKLSTPAYFIVLDKLVTIKGFSDEYKSGFYSNEVHSTKKEDLHVRTFKGGFTADGKYDEIKDRVKAKGGKYSNSIYCLRLEKDKEPELVNLQLFGAAGSAWFDFKYNPQSQVIVLTGETHTEKKGSTIYHIPHFKTVKLDEKFIPIAIEEDKKLQVYLRKRKEQTTGDEQSDEESISNFDVDSEPEKTDAETWHENTYEQDAPKREKGNESVKADDIPYPPEFQDAPPPEEPPEAAEDDDLPF